jgi:predicted membrane protein
LRLILDKRIFLGIILSLGILVIIKLNLCIIFILCILLSILLYYYIKLCNNVLSKQEYQNAYLVYNCLLFIFNLFIQIFLTYSIGFAESAVIIDLELQIQILNQDLLVTQEILNELQNSLHNSW